MLTQTRAKDRATMAARLGEIAERHGFAADVHPASWDPSEELLVAITTKRGLILSTDFNRRSTWEFLGHWHMETDSDACLKLAFGNVNPHHQRKATLHGGDDFEAFAAEVDRMLRKVATEDVFDADKEAASIAKNGTAAARAAQFAEWRAEEDAKRAALTAEGFEAVDYAEVSAAGGYGVQGTLEALQARYGADGARFISGIGYWARQAQRVAA